MSELGQSTESAPAAPTPPAIAGQQQQQHLSRPSAPVQRKSFLGKLPAVTRRIPRPIPSKLNPFKSGSAGTAERRRTLFEPIDTSSSPLGTLVIRVHQARDLVAKDRNGLSDPFCVVRYALSRVTSTTAYKTLNPVWGKDGDGEAVLEVKVWESAGFGRERVEIILWDRDRLGKEYMGEVSLGMEDWWGKSTDGHPPLEYNDPGNKPIWHSIRSSRSRSHVSGSIQVQIGFIPTRQASSAHPTTPGAAHLPPANQTPPLSDTERERLLRALQRVTEEREGQRRASKEERVLLASPTEGVGTHTIEEHSQLGFHPAAGAIGVSSAADDDEDTGSSESDTSSIGSDDEDDTEEEEEEEEDETAEEEDRDEGSLATSHHHHHHHHKHAPDEPRPQGHHHHHHHHHHHRQPSQSEQESESEPPSSSRTEYFDAPLPIPLSSCPTSSSTPTILPTPFPPSPSQQLPPTTPGGTHRPRLSLPAFMKRTGSSRSVTLAGLGAGEGSEYSPSLNTPSIYTDGGGGESASSAGVGGVKKKKKRFSRSNKLGLPPSGGEGVGTEEGKKDRKKKKKKTDRERDGGESSAGGVGAAGVGEKKRRLGRKGTKRGYRLEEGDDIFGLVQIEAKGAKGLPKIKNMLKTGWDMDAFLVVSFGKKVFRTRVIRHSLNPIWDEKLFFHVRPTETNWIVAFNVYDWDKISSNDHVGDVSVPLEDLLGQSIQVDEKTGLYPTNKEGKLVGDDFHEHSLKIEISGNGNGVAGGEKDGGDHATLEIRAKFTPYAALRQQFWRLFSKTYDIDESGAFSHLEIFSMLDSLGSTLSRETISSFFTRLGKTEDEELTTDELVLCLEAELKKHPSEKRPVESGSAGLDLGLTTPSISSSGSALGFTGIAEQGREMSEITEAVTAPRTDLSKNTKVIQPGTEIVTSEEHGTVVTAPPLAQTQATSVHSLEHSPQSSDEAVSGAEDNVERIINIKTCPLCHKPRLNSKAELDIVTHMGICASAGIGSVNRIVVGEYVTASQAQRKWFTKVISKATKGAYSLGANSANIIVQDRQTGMLTEEKMAVYVRLGIRLMYKGMGAGGGMESARIRRMLESMSHKQGIKFDSPSSVREIAPFVEFHNLNLDEILDPMSSFKNFNEFFYRKLKPTARPVSDPDDPRTLVSPADCRAMFFETVSEATKIWIKGREFSVGRLLGENFKDKAHLYEGASLAIFRLAPQDYHRYHSPVDGVMGEQHHINGAYFTVNPMAVRSSIDIYGENVRLVGSIISPVFGEVMNVWVGAMMVGSIVMTRKEGDPIQRGEETGFFKFGGSTIVLLFPPGSVLFDEDLLTNSRASVETLVRMGSRIGKRK